MADFTICTIIAKNYVSFARTLCNSFLEHHPSGTCYVMIIDNYEGYIDPSKELFKIIELKDLGVPNIKKFCFKYNVIELATACKPYLLKHLIDNESLEKLLYIDPDILITNPLDKLFNELNKADIIVTPHIEQDYPDDGLMPNDSTIMLHGVFNLGFIGVSKSENTDKFLKWWREKLYCKCLIDYKKGYFVDQKFIDLAVCLFEKLSIMRDCGYNVSYWNLHSRTVCYDDNDWKCNDGKLYFYHFSNFKPENPDHMSTYQNRFDLASMPDLKQLYSGYAKRVMENDYGVSKKWPYTYNYFSNGEPVIDLIRKMYRTNKHLEALSDPFDINGYNSRYRMVFKLFRMYKKCTKFILHHLKMIA